MSHSIRRPQRGETHRWKKFYVFLLQRTFSLKRRRFESKRIPVRGNTPRKAVTIYKQMLLMKASASHLDNLSQFTEEMWNFSASTEGQ